MLFQKQQRFYRPDGVPDQAEVPADPPAPKTPDPVPYDRFKTVNDELATLKKWKQEQTASQAEAEAARLKEQGDYKTLAEQAQAKIKELEAQSVELDRHRAANAKQLSAKLKTLTPEAKKAVEALPDAMSALDKLNWLIDNEAAFVVPSKAPPPNLNAQTGGGPKGTDPTERIEELRARYRL